VNELHVVYKIRQRLNRGLQDVTPETSRRLAIARENALAHQKKRASRSILSAAGAFIHFDLQKGWVKQFLVAGIFLTGIASSTLWMADRRIEEIGTIDIALLADDLPIGVFADKGFNAWLNYTSQE